MILVLMKDIRVCVCGKAWNGRLEYRFDILVSMEEVADRKSVV